MMLHMNLPNLINTTRVALDTETHDPHIKTLGAGVRRGGYVCGVSLAAHNGGQIDSWYLPIAHADGNMPKQQVVDYLTDFAKQYRGELVGANILYDLDYLAEMGIEFKQAKIIDIQHNEALIDEWQLSYSLDSIAKKYGFVGKEEVLLETAFSHMKSLHPDLFKKSEIKNAKGAMSLFSAEMVEMYARMDAELCLLILEKQEIEINRQNLHKIVKLERDVWPVVFAMRRHGVAVDVGRIEQNADILTKQINQALFEMQQDVPLIDIDESTLTNPKKLVLALGVNTPLTPTGQPKVTNEWLEMQDQPCLRILSHARRLLKTRDNFVTGILKFVTNGRLHASFNQLRGSSFSGKLQGVGPGRFSSSGPNLQQQPSRDPELGPLVRSQYIADEGKQFCAIDFSQQEPRMALHYAAKLGLDGADALLSLYRANKRQDSYTPIAQVAGIDRSAAKAIMLGISYGMGGGKLCRQLGFPTKMIKSKKGELIEVAGSEGQAVIDAFDFNVPYVRELAKRVRTRAEEVGYIRTIGGRVCRLERGSRGEYLFSYKAFNNLMQGSGADMTKQAMVNMHAAGYTPQLQVHDELCLSVSNCQQAKICADIMEQAIPTLVPSHASVEMGPNWGDMKEIE